MDETKKALLSIDIDTAALTQNVANAKASVTALTDQLKAMKAAGTDGGEAFDKVSEQLKKAGEQAGKSTDALKDYTRGMGDSTKAASDLSRGMADLAKQHGSLKDGTEKTTKSLSDYGKELVEAAENANPVAKSIGETAKQFKTFREVAGLVGTELGQFKKHGDDASKNALTLSTNAGNAARGFETLTTGTEAVTGSVSMFSKALASTGIGLIIVAVAALIDYLKQVTPLMDGVERVTAGLSGGFNALGRIVMDLLSPLKKLFTDPKQAMTDLVNFLEQNVINRFKAFGVILDAIENHNLKQFTNGVLQLGTGVTDASEKMAKAASAITGYGKAIYQAGVATAELKGKQQELAASVESEALKATETEAKIAELRVKARTGDLAQRKAYNKQIADLETAQKKLHADNINTGVDLAVKDVAVKRALTQEEVDLIKSKGAAELDALVKAGRIYEGDVKELSEALTKKYGLRKEYADKIKTLNVSKTAEHKKFVDENAAIAADAEKVKQAEEKAAAAQEINDQKTLSDMKAEANIKGAEKNYTEVFKLKTAQNKFDQEQELKQLGLTETQKAIIIEKYRQLQADAKKENTDANYQHNKEQQAQDYDDELSQDKKEIDRLKNNNSLRLKEELKYLDDKRAADIFNANGNQKEIAKIEENYLSDIKNIADEEQKIVSAKAKAYASYFSTLTNLFGKNTEAGKAAFIAQKAIAAAEIAINTEKQVSSIYTSTRKAVSNDMDEGPLIGPIHAAIDIALGAAEVVAAITNGVKQATSINSTNPQGFARGGIYNSDGYGTYLFGKGTGTSDSINARLSNGESVINARSTEMFAPILSAINMAGGGRPFNTINAGTGYALGGLFNGSNTLNDGSSELANTRAMNDMAKTMAANMPRQILVVEDVQASLQNKAMLQNMSNF